MSIADELEARARRLREELEAAERRSALDLLLTAKRYSSGTVSARELERLDRPYARRHGAPRLNPSILNRQSGAFEEGWELREGTGPEGQQALTLVNTDPEAVLKTAGSRSAFGRPILEAVAAEVGPRRVERWRRAIARATDSE